MDSHRLVCPGVSGNANPNNVAGSASGDDVPHNAQAARSKSASFES